MTTKPMYAVTVSAADASVAGSSPATNTFTLSITGSGITVPDGQTTTDASSHTGSYQLVKQGGGTLILDKANTHTGGTVVEAGTVVVKNASALGTGGVLVKAGATVVIDPAAGEALAGSLVIEEGGFVDVGLGRIRIASGMTASALTAAMLAAKGDGTWNGGTGLGSTAVETANANFTPRTLGWLDNGDGSFTVGFAAPGDTGLDGLVDIIDVANFLASGKMDSGENATWDTGDFNLDGFVDQLDLADFLGAALYDVGPYVPGEAGMTAAATSASQRAETVDSGSTQQTAIQTAFAALASETTTTPTVKRKVFAVYR
jgi:autotransporter-associated beta strand protein